jgi:hypothetical protein
MTRLVACARRRGFARLEGAVLRANQAMLRFTNAFGFTTTKDAEDPEQVIVTLDLAAPA